MKNIPIKRFCKDTVFKISLQGFRFFNTPIVGSLKTIHLFGLLCYGRLCMWFMKELFNFKVAMTARYLKLPVQKISSINFT